MLYPCNKMNLNNWKSSMNHTVVCVIRGNVWQKQVTTDIFRQIGQIGTICNKKICLLIRVKFLIFAQMGYTLAFKRLIFFRSNVQSKRSNVLRRVKPLFNIIYCSFCTSRELFLYHSGSLIANIKMQTFISTTSMLCSDGWSY